MKSSGLKNYGGRIKRLAQANARDDQLKVIRDSRFRASLVDDPLNSSADIVSAIDNARNRSSKG